MSIPTKESPVPYTPEPGELTSQGAADLIQRYAKGDTITLKDARTGIVVDTDPEGGCLWMTPTDDERDERVWASQIRP